MQIWYVEVRISRSISERPLEFEMTRVDCNDHSHEHDYDHDDCDQGHDLVVYAPFNII